MVSPLASHNAYSIINSTIVFLRPRWGPIQFFGYVMKLALALCDTNGTVNGTTQFLRPRQWKSGATLFFSSRYATGISASVMCCWWYCKWFPDFLDWNEMQHDVLSSDSIGVTICITWFWWNHQWHLNSWGQDNGNGVQHDFFQSCADISFVWHDINGIINSIMQFLRQWWSKWGATWLFWSYTTIHISIRNISCQWHFKWHMTLMP